MDTSRSQWQARNHLGYWAFVVHRVSGMLLAFFLPLHFWTLSLAIRGEAALDGFLRWTEQPLVKVAECILVVLLAAHLTGGLRLLALEFLPWHDWQKTWVALAASLSLAVGVLFLLNVV
jgi:fumarate reductase subunit D